jgi:HK97 gp10 family phage protein
LNAKDYIRLKAKAAGGGRISMQLEGIDELESKLQRLPHRLRNKAMRRGITKAARVLVKEMKARVPSDTRALRRALTYVVKTPKNNGKARGYPYAILGPKSDHYTVTRKRGKWKAVQSRVRPSLYEHLVNAGAKPHQILTRNGKPLQKDIMHPGTPATNYRRSAVEAAKARVMQILADEVQHEINRMIAQKGIAKS